ncbi:ribokinase [Treponema sp.]
MPRILNIGSINLDEVFSVPHFIRPGETMASLDYERFIGGKGNNQSTALARAGAEVHHAGKIGSDAREAVNLLRESGVDVGRIIESNIPTGRALIQVDPAGQNCIILYGGANRAIDTKDVDFFLEGWGKGDALLLQNETSEGAYAIEEASKRGIRVFLNPSPADEIIEKLPLDKVDCFILNEVEAAMLCPDGTAKGSDDPEALLRGLRSRFPKADILLTLGGAGSRYAGRDGSTFALPAGPARPVDTTAAGDTYTGYFLSAILSGKSPDTAMAEATRAADICVTRKGAASSIPRKEELGIS